MELLSQRGVSRRKRSLRKFAVTGVAVCAAVVLAVPGAQAAGTPGWRFVAVFPQAQQLLSVSAASATNAWAVGQTSGLGLFTSHWNGKTWSKVAAPEGVHFDGLASDGHGGCWAASYTFTTPGAVTGLVMYHYSGGRWTHVPAPAKSGYTGTVFGGNMQLIPGTRSVLEHATLNPDHGGTFPAGAVLKYGP
jgi:hypothetical protein